MQRLLLDLLAAAGLLGLAFALHGDALALGWSHDDPSILCTAATVSPFAYFFDPAVHGALGATTFTPMLGASYAVDSAAFGLDPRAFYAHQLLALGAVAVGLYLLLRTLGRPVAMAAAVAFLLSAPAAVSARVLMNRNYLEGAAWFLFAMALLRRQTAPGPGLGRRAAAVLLDCLAGLCCLAAMLNKEIYAPLLLAAPLLLLGERGGRAGEGGDAERSRASGAFARWLSAARLWPVAVALVVYVPWRLLMHPALGGYATASAADVLDLGHLWRGAWALVAMVAGAAHSDGRVTVAAAVLLGGLAVAAWWSGRRAAAAGAAVALAAAAPLAPVWRGLDGTGYPKYRLVVHVAVLVAIAGAALLSRGAAPAAPRRLRAAAWTAALAVLAVLAAQQHRLVADLLAQVRPHMRDVAFLFRESAGVTLVVDSPLHSQPAVARLRQALRGEEAPAACTMPFDLRDQPSQRYFRYDPARDAHVDVSAHFAAARRALQARCAERPLAVELCSDGDGLHISVDGGGRPGASYYLLTSSVSGAYQSLPVAATTVHPHRLRSGTYVRLLRVDSDGAFVWSPEWRAGDGRLEVHWSR